MLDDEDKFSQSTWLDLSREIAGFRKQYYQPKFYRFFGSWLRKWSRDLDLELSIELAFKGISRDR